MRAKEVTVNAPYARIVIKMLRDLHKTIMLQKCTPLFYCGAVQAANKLPLIIKHCCSVAESSLAETSTTTAAVTSQTTLATTLLKTSTTGVATTQTGACSPRA